MTLEGEIALVTGASRGIGKAVAVALAREGAEVIVNYVRNQEKAEQVCNEISANGGRAELLRFDVAKPDEVQAAIDGYAKSRKISILVNNAGITRDGLMLRYSPADWDDVIQTNLRGAFFVSQAVLKGMMKERKGSIILMSSVVGIGGNAGQAAYSAAKAGLLGLTRSMAKEFATRSIRVNAIAPGYIETDMTAELTGEQKEKILQAIPLRRVGKPEEIAQAAVYLASPLSSYMTGQVIVVDGGMSM
ncbi:MAG: 3-oxoacyl-[acyl-carrier-protein] reductase [Deltaproteobacteria bacterium]|nr:3-oxoacyl-[acyl-carrier-protein] reductase [Deltaproteobacteria bacterium]